MLLNIWTTLGNTLYDIRRAWSLADDFQSRLRLCSDFILYRLIKVIDLKSIDQERTIHCANNVTLTYRLNRGDIQSIREVWLDEAYRLPFSLQPNLIVDLGANIGLTSIWLWKNYKVKKIIAVEASSTNAELVRRNFSDNNINANVIEAAIGSYDGIATFDASKESNLGKVVLNSEQTNNKHKIRMISMATLLANVPKDEIIDLVKMDIEGGEQQLLSSNLSWLTRIKAMIAEFHPDRVDYPGLVKILEQQGFRYIAANTVHPDNMDAFLSKTVVDSRVLSSKRATVKC